MTTTTAAPTMNTSLIQGFCRCIGTGVLLVVLADFLLHGQPAGFSILLFGIVLAATVVAMHPAALNDGRVWLKPVALFVALLPLVENAGPVSVLVAPGLAFLIARITLTKSSEWPLFANLPTLSAGFYAGCFVKKATEERHPADAFT